MFSLKLEQKYTKILKHFHLLCHLLIRTSLYEANLETTGRSATTAMTALTPGSRNDLYYYAHTASAGKRDKQVLNKTHRFGKIWNQRKTSFQFKKGQTKYLIFMLIKFNLDTCPD